jgi:hypothetical protein
MSPDIEAFRRKARTTSRLLPLARIPLAASWCRYVANRLAVGMGLAIYGQVDLW